MKRCHKLTNNQIQELSNIIKDNKRSGRETRRAQSVLMLNADVDDKAITALTGYERRQVFRLRKRYLHRGIKAR